MEQKELTVEVRETVGKGASRRLRGISKVPAVLYGPHLGGSVHLAVDAKTRGDADLKALISWVLKTPIGVRRVDGSRPWP